MQCVSVWVEGKWCLCAHWQTSEDSISFFASRGSDYAEKCDFSLHCSHFAGGPKYRFRGNQFLTYQISNCGERFFCTCSVKMNTICTQILLCFPIHFHDTCKRKSCWFVPLLCKMQSPSLKEAPVLINDYLFPPFRTEYIVAEKIVAE